MTTNGLDVKLMRKRILPVLLSFVLFCSLVTTAFAKPMMLVLEATGDTSKEFVINIRTNQAYTDPAQKMLKKLKKEHAYVLVENLV